MKRGQAERPLYLLASARPSLAPDVAVDGEGLRDAGGPSYPLNPVGRFVVHHLDGRLSIGELADEVARHFHIDASQADSDLRGFLFDLHAHHLVSIRQSYLQELLARMRHALAAIRDRTLLGAAITYAYPNRRYPVSPGHVAVACLEAHQPTICYGIIGALGAGAIVALPSLVRGQSVAMEISIQASLLVLIYVAVFVASSWVHESIHCWAARRLGVRLKSVFVRMHVVGVTHEARDPLKTASVSAAGPAATIAILGLLAALMWNLPLISLSVRMELAVLLLAVALQHLPGLTPLTADGRLAVAAMELLARSRMANR
jgi:hypothetical protein